MKQVWKEIINKEKLILTDKKKIKLETGVSLTSLRLLSTDKAVLLAVWDRLLRKT